MKMKKYYLKSVYIDKKTADLLINLQKKGEIKNFSDFVRKKIEEESKK